MADDLNLNNKNDITKLFEEMDYGFKEQTPVLATNWISSNQQWIDNILRYCGKTAEYQSATKVQFINSDDTKLSYPEAENKVWLEANKFNRIKVLQKLASLLEQNSSLFAELDAMERNIPLHHVVENDVPYFVQYFHLCSFMPLQLSKFVKKINWTPDVIESVKITRLIPLYELCWNISPFLVCGHTVKLAVDNKSVLLTLLFIKLCHQAGVPEDVLRLESIRAINESSCCYSPSIALVFDYVDITSAVDAIAEGAWSHNGLVPWSIKRILVQESMYEIFIKELLKKMKKLKFGNVFNTLTDFGKPHSSEIFTDLQEIVSKADSEGLEVHQVEGSNEEFIKPTLIIGRPQCLFENATLLPVVTLEAFRTIQESLKLVKNSHFFTSASLWTDSNSVLRKATFHLMQETNIQTVWLNVHGMLDPSVPFFVQSSTHGVKEDLLSYFFKKSFPDVTVMFNPEPPDIITRVDKTILSMSEIESILAASSKAQATWYNVGSLKRLSVLSSAALTLINKKAELESFQDLDGSEDGECLETLVEFMINISSHNQYSKNFSADIAQGGTVIMSHKQQGVVLLQIQTINNFFTLLKLLVSFISFGNSLIIITKDSDKINKFYDILKCDIPLNLINVINCKGLVTEIVANEVVPDVEVIAVNSFISKTALSLK